MAKKDIPLDTLYAGASLAVKILGDVTAPASQDKAKKILDKSLDLISIQLGVKQ